MFKSNNKSASYFYVGKTYDIIRLLEKNLCPQKFATVACQPNLCILSSDILIYNIFAEVNMSKNGKKKNLKSFEYIWI